MQQLITPNPNIPCEPGWCLAYVNEAFGVPKRYGSATAAWNGSATKHRDYDFPAGVWVPIWFSLKYEPNGHVALMAPDGSVYSTTDPYGYTPRRHPNLADLLSAYARNNPLTYLGWTEDVEDTPVLAAGISLANSGTITPLDLEEGNFMSDLTKDEQRRVLAAADMILDTPGRGNPATVLNTTHGGYIVALLEALSGKVGNTLNKADGGYIVGLVSALKPGATDTGAIAAAVVSAVGKDLAADVVAKIGEKLGAA